VPPELDEELELGGGRLEVLGIGLKHEVVAPQRFAIAILRFVRVPQPLTDMRPQDPRFVEARVQDEGVVDGLPRLLKAVDVE